MNTQLVRASHCRASRLKCLSIRQAAHALHAVAAEQAERSVALGAICRLLVEACGCAGAWIVLVDERGRFSAVERAGASVCPRVAHARVGGPAPECLLKAVRGAGMTLTGRCEKMSMASSSGPYHLATVFPPVGGGAGLGGVVGLLSRRHSHEAWTDEALVTMTAEVVGAILEHQAMDDRLEGARTNLETLQTQFFRAQKMETLGQLSGGIAHDVNNQLTVIRGYADMLARRVGKDSALRRLVEVVQRATDRSAATLTRVAAFGRAESAPPQVIDLNTVVRETHEALSPLLGKRIRWSLATIAEPACARGDRALMDQALVNLVINARDAMPEGGQLSLRTGLESAVDRPLRVLMAVGDTGIGMDEATRLRIFDPFFTTKAPGRGTGLGLAMVHNFIQQSGGRVDVESTPGRGTTFTLSFPRVAAVTA